MGSTLLKMRSMPLAQRMPNTAMFYSVWCDPAVMNGNDPARDEHLLDYYFASLASYGVKLGMLGMEVYTNDVQKGVVRRWLAFIRDYRSILEKDVVHLADVDGRHIDAIVHVDPDTARCGLLAAFNPTDRRLRSWVMGSKEIVRAP